MKKPILVLVVLMTVAQLQAQTKEPGSLNTAMLAKLRKAKLKAIYLPSYLPKDFKASKLDLQEGEYRLFYQGPNQASFSIWGRNQGVADGGPSDLHFPIKAGPFKSNTIEYNKAQTGFYTGFMRINPQGGEVEPSFDIEGQNLSPKEAQKVIESLRKL